MASQKNKSTDGRLFRQLHELLLHDNLKDAECLITSNKQIFDCLNSNSVYTLLLNYYLKSQNFEKAITTFESLVQTSIYHKRHLLLFMCYFKNNSQYSKMLEFFKIYWNPKFEITSKDLEIFNCLEKTQLNTILEMFCGTHLKLPESFTNTFDVERNLTCPHCFCDLKTISTDEEKFKIIEYVKTQMNKKIFTKAKATFERMDYNNVIDGANVLFSCGTKITVQSYYRLINTIELRAKTHKVLLVLHQRHFQINYKWPKKTIADIKQSLKYLSTIKNCYVYKTPAKMNDDLFFLLACSIKQDCHLISNDILRDHLYKMGNNTLTIWGNDNRLQYKFPHSGSTCININSPKKYSTIIQSIEGGFHVPTVKDNIWVCTKI